MAADQDRVHEIHALTLQAWHWYKEKSQTIPSKRDNYYWQTVTDDIKNAPKKIDNKYCRKFLKNIMVTYMNALQDEFTEWINTRQEKLPI